MMAQILNGSSSDSENSSGIEGEGEEGSEEFVSSSGSAEDSNVEENEEYIPLIDLADSDVGSVPDHHVLGASKGEFVPVGLRGELGPINDKEPVTVESHHPNSQSPDSVLRFENCTAAAADNGTYGRDESFEDLYGDLEPMVFQRFDQPERKSHQELTARVQEVESLLVAAYDQIAELQLKLKVKSKAHYIVCKNASSLYETAKNQITQKNHMLTQLQKKMQEIRTKYSNPSNPAHVEAVAKRLQEIDDLTIGHCVSDSIPTFSFKELCQEAFQNFKGKTREDLSRNQKKEWKKRFQYENVSYYFYSYPQDFTHKERTTDIAYTYDESGKLKHPGEKTTTIDLPKIVIHSEHRKDNTDAPDSVLVWEQNTQTTSGSSQTLLVQDEKRRNRSDSGEISGSPDPYERSPRPRSCDQERRRSPDRSRSKDDTSPRDRYYTKEKAWSPNHTGYRDYNQPPRKYENHDRSRSREYNYRSRRPATEFHSYHDSDRRRKRTQYSPGRDDRKRYHDRR